MFSSQIDPKIAEFNKGEVYNTPLVQDVWKKYFYKDEKTPDEVFKRVAHAISMSPIETESSEAYELFYGALKNHLFLPGGRILAGAGTSKRVTLMNCYVNGTLEDSMEGIMAGVSTLALTSQQGGGVGTDFSPLRPENAILSRTQSAASGTLPFMDVFNQTGKTIRSAGDRRAAQMGTISDTHPDMPAFVMAKGEGLKDKSMRFAEFNLSILVSDAFLAAIEDDAEWLLYFPIPPVAERPKELVELDFVDDQGVTQYVYSKWLAADLWAMITKYTHEFSDPGVIYIDRINDLNNLQYCETIRCTNPCVTGDTVILTRNGWRAIKSLVGKEVEVWNGFEWSKTIPFSTGENELMEITFTNGHTVRCTPYHKWILSDGRKVEARYLTEKDKLLYINMPSSIQESTEFAIDAYSQGMYCGDGTKNSEYSNLYKHDIGILNRLVGKIYDRNCESQPGTRWVHGTMLPKDFVPITGSVEYCVNWLAGWLDADGSALLGKGVIEASAKDRNFLQRVGLMLNRLGVNYRIWERKDAGLKNGSNGESYMCESTAALMIAHKGIHTLLNLGLKCERLDLSMFKNAPRGVANVGHRVLSIKKLQHKEETFCLNEPLRNMFVANGVITGNCGEQPLPPNGTCNLGAINVANIIREPFTPNASINYELLEELAALGIRFLDNVINVTGYPLEAQKEEEYAKRRVGLGIFGLGTMFAELGVKYGSAASVNYATSIMKTICLAAYRESIRLATLRGKFPLFDDIIVDGGFISERLPQELKDSIKTNGLRNGVLLTIAPVGTGSIVFGSLSSGLEPDFAHEYERKVRSKNKEEWVTYIEKSYTKRFYEFCTKDTQTPSYMVTAQDIEILDHIKIQGALQRWVDASVSKTINVPEDIPYDKFLEVYQLAYHYGCKGCTTYRPSEWRHNILTAPSDQPEKANSPVLRPRRSTELSGTTYKIKWPSLSASMFITINYSDGLPYEIFFASKDARHSDYLTALTLMMSLILRSGIDPALVPNELQQVVSAYDGQWSDGKYFGSLVARIAETIRKDFIKHGIIEDPNTVEHGLAQKIKITESDAQIKGEQCPQCHSYTLLKLQGCKNCTTCGYSSC